ncbi:MAG: 23S rRNA (guanosine(2251)-2'-O)-methyltransferase RlmB [Spirochaetota bacterium]
MSRSSPVLGVNAVAELFRRGSPQGTLLFAGGNKRVLELVAEAERRGVKIRRVEAKEVARYGAPQSQPIVFLVSGSPDRRGTLSPDLLSLGEFLERKRDPSSLTIFLDGVTDPHNIGAIYRVADQFGAEAVGLPGRRSGSINETVAKTSSGAVFHVETVQLAGVAEAIRRAKEHGFWIYGADARGTIPERLRFAGPAILVMGSEGKGLHRLVRDRCDDLIAIPTWGQVDSLNVSVAAGILVYELRRHLGAPTPRGTL